MQPYLHIFSHFVVLIPSIHAKSLQARRFSGATRALRPPADGATTRASGDCATALATPHPAPESATGCTIGSRPPTTIARRSRKELAPCPQPPARRPRPARLPRLARRRGRARASSPRCSRRSSRAACWRAAAPATAAAPSPTRRPPCRQAPSCMWARPCARAERRRPTRSPPDARSRTRATRTRDCSGRCRRPAHRRWTSVATSRPGWAPTPASSSPRCRPPARWSRCWSRACSAARPGERSRSGHPAHRARSCSTPATAPRRARS